MYNVRVEKDSIAPSGFRATTFVITFPRVCLPEVMTHRLASSTWGDGVSLCERPMTPDVSMNSASSRAIPFERMVAALMEDPYMPMWTLQQKGMQGADCDDAENIKAANGWWLQARDLMIQHARVLHDECGIAKQDVNRLLEPWAWITQIVTSSRWDNFFALRCHHMAFPPFRLLARMMFLARRRSSPVVMLPGHWHLPFVDRPDLFYWKPDPLALLEGRAEIPDEIRFSAARCAWVSYANHEKVATPEAHLSTYNRLLADEIKHASPVEHQLTPMSAEWERFPHLHSNVTGWLQARKLIPREEVRRYEPGDEEVSSWNIPQS